MNKWIQTRIYDLTQSLLEYESMNKTVRFQQFFLEPQYDKLSPERQASAYAAPLVDFRRSVLNGKHYLNQVNYIHDRDGTKLIKHILHFENLQEEFNDLMQLYNLPLNLTVVNVGTYKSSNNKLSVRDLYPETIHAINEYASVDFRMLGYKMVHSSFELDYSYSASVKVFK